MPSSGSTLHLNHIWTRQSEEPQGRIIHIFNGYNKNRSGDDSNMLETLIDSLSTASHSLPDAEILAAPSEGISLLDTKNELLLAYLQNLVFLIIIKLRNLAPGNEGASHDSLAEDVAKKLVELRVYLEKGVRPLESKLKYQLDKLLAVASEATSTGATNDAATFTKASNGHSSHSEATQDDSKAGLNSGPIEVSDLSYRPNPSAFARPSSQSANNPREESSGIYKPPRITPTALHTTDRAPQRSSRPRKSTTVDAFIREELTDAPITEPSIGAGSGSRGKEREREEERRAYEEQKLVRLPGDKMKRRRIGSGGEDLEGGFGGLGDIDFGERKSKRRAGEGGGIGERMGERWEKRVNKGVGRKRR
ncbi:MAG: hypothetical protein Q9217_000603 [Psora testacea]